MPCGPVNRASDIVDDPHVAARRMLVDLPQPGTERAVAVAGAPIKFLASGEPQFRRAPRLGEHTAGVLQSLGYPADRVEVLRQQGVVR